MKKKASSGIFVLTGAAMLAAVSIVIGMFCKTYLNFGNGLFRITLENFPIILSGILFGPWIGACVGAAADVVSYVLSTQSLAINPLVTLGAAAVGLTAGLVSRYLIKKEGVRQIAFSTFLAHLVGSVLIKCPALYVFYGIAVLWRVPIYAVIATLECVLLVLLYRNQAFYRAVWKKRKV